MIVFLLEHGDADDGLAGGTQARSGEPTLQWRRMGQENSATLSAAWHRRRGFIESERRRPSLWDLTVAAG